MHDKKYIQFLSLFPKRIELFAFVVFSVDVRRDKTAAEVKVSNGALNTYNGYGTLYLSGTFRATGTLCAAVSGSSCNFAGWSPDADLLMIVANGNGGQVNPGDSIQVDNNFSYQGGLYGTNAVEFGNNVSVDGPIVGSQILLSNNLTTNAFPNISVVPVGMPSNQNVYAQPNPPQNFSG